MPVKSSYPDAAIPNESVYDIFIKRVNTTNDGVVALVDNMDFGKSLTFQQVESYARNCAGFLNYKGLKKGDVVAIYAESCIEYVVVSLGILACGATVAAINCAFKRDELLHLCNISKPKIAVVGENQLKRFKVVQENIDSLREIFVLDNGNNQDFSSVGDFMKENLSESDLDFQNKFQINPEEDVAFLLYSSGTTGLPKCVMLTHKNVASFYVLRKIALPIMENKVYYSTTTISHIGGIVFIYLSLMEGAQTIIDKSNDDTQTKFRQVIQKYKVTDTLVTPPNTIRYVREVNEETYDMSSLKTVLTGGGSLVPHIVLEMGKKLNARMVPCYGTTEAGVCFYNLEADCYPTSVGTLLPNNEAKIIDSETGDELPTGVDGEILLRSPMIMKGYLGNDEATRDAITYDGWFRTGDFGHFDEGGRLYITARIKELIKYGSYQVSPAELESLIMNHPKVMDVGVIGIPNDIDGEHPKAFVVKKDYSLTENEVIFFIKEKVIDYKRLRGGVEFVEFIPKSAQGKIQRIELKKMAGIL